MLVHSAEDPQNADPHVHAVHAEHLHDACRLWKAVVVMETVGCDTVRAGKGGATGKDPLSARDSATGRSCGGNTLADAGASKLFG